MWALHIFSNQRPNASHYFAPSSDRNPRGRIRSKRGRRSTRSRKLHRLHCNGAPDERNLCLDGIAVVSTPDHVRVNVADAEPIVRRVVFMVQLRESCLCWECRAPALKLVTARRRDPNFKPQRSSSSIGRRSNDLQGIVTPSLRQQRHTATVAGLKSAQRRFAHWKDASRKNSKPRNQTGRSRFKAAAAAGCWLFAV